MFQYAMKAAAGSEAQLRHRVECFKKLGIEPLIELYLSGSADVLEPERNSVIRNCRNFNECKYIVHFPIMDAKTGYVYDGYEDEREKLEAVLDFAGEIDAGELIMHCCYGFGRDIPKEEAIERFFEKVAVWNDLANSRSLKILLENYGFVWLPDGFGKDYVVSPIDHCFPWDMARMHERIEQWGLHSVAILLDVAHAVLSSNMFNMKKTCPGLAADGRFRNISKDDVGRKDFLKVGDFVFDFIDYFHISDAFVWKPENGIDNMRKYLYTENLPIGKGNVDFIEITKDTKGSEVMVMEINPENGDHANNISQCEAIKWFQKTFKGED